MLFLFTTTQLYFFSLPSLCLFHTHHCGTWKSHRPKPILVHHKQPESSLLDQQGKKQHLLSVHEILVLSLISASSWLTVHIDLIHFHFFFPFWPQFPCVLFMWSTEPPQDALAVTELNSLWKNESLNNRNLNYDRWNWDIRIVLNKVLLKPGLYLDYSARKTFIACCTVATKHP